MWPDRVSNPGPLTYQSGALPTALSSLAISKEICIYLVSCSSLTLKVQQETVLNIFSLFFKENKT